jgi:UDP-N-acetylmuramoyl-tripeptide--D-alanyl-D-alanine ligase
MAELGPTSMQLHAQVGAFASSLRQVDELVVIGDGIEAEALVAGWQRGRGAQARRYDDVDQATARTVEWFAPGDVVLVKASNSMGLGRLASHLVERVAGGAPQ